MGDELQQCNGRRGQRENQHERCKAPYEEGNGAIEDLADPERTQIELIHVRKVFAQPGANSPT
ncbi:MAG: hypothetical protein NVS2B17_22050 [Candidatus Velthaea sp.]